MRIAVAMAALVLAACAERDVRPVERLDPRTAVNVTLMADPWVYARPLPMLAANARDYLNVGIVETNRAGTRAYWLGVVSWSTIDRTQLPAGAGLAQPGRLRLAWKEDKLELSPAPQGRAAVGLTEPALTQPAERSVDAWYALSAADLKRLSASAPESVSLVDDDGGLRTYDAWTIHPASMAQFLKATGLDHP
jgi:hypothetical protein